MQRIAYKLVYIYTRGKRNKSTTAYPTLSPQSVVNTTVAQIVRRSTFLHSLIHFVFHSLLFTAIMESELVRLNTFVNWTQTGQSVRLSRRGFYAAGRDRTVVCHLCRSEFDDWNDVDELLAVHRVRSPRCAGSRELETVLNDSSYSDVTDIQRQGLSQVRIERTSLSNSSSAIGGGGGVTVDSVSAGPDFDRLRSERARLETFDNWPPRAARVVDPRDLAEAGLFYTGQQDRVQCAFCRGLLRNWIRGDRPADEHRKHFPDCPFVRGMDVGNIRYVESGSDLPSALPSVSSSVSYQNSTSERPINLAETPSLSAREPDAQRCLAKHPEFADVNKRVESFRRKQVGDGQTADGLAQAGYYHIGPQDNVRCFQCDGGLKNWRPTDDPWTEHARWFPRCPFLLANKDQSFIRNAQIVKSGVRNQTFQPTNAKRGRYHVEPREIKARMDSATVQAVINMGYRRELVRQVIERRLTIAGDDFPNTQSLLEAVFEMEDEPSLQRDSNDTGFFEKSTVSTQSSTASFQSTSSTSFSARGEAPQAPTSATSSNQQSVSNSVNQRSETLDHEAQAVLEENRRLREARTCSVCMDKEVNTVFLPCGHLVCCNECSQSLTNCAVCRALIRGTVKIFLS